MKQGIGEVCAAPVEMPEQGSEEDDLWAARWLAGVANGQRSCFRHLYDRFEPLLFTTVFRVLNDREDTEDVLQEVWAMVWKKAGMYEKGKGRPATWLASMARNRAIDRLRLKQRRARLRDDFEAQEQTLSGTATAASAAELAERRERCQQVRRAVFELTADQQEAIRMAYFEGMTQKDIAERVGKPLGTIKARVRRAMGALRDKL